MNYVAHAQVNRLVVAKNAARTRTTIFASRKMRRDRRMKTQHKTNFTMSQTAEMLK